jgi:hypothetical protein
LSELNSTQIEATLRTALPADLQGHVPKLAALLLQALHEGAVSRADPALLPLFQSLGGKHVKVGGSVIQFGSGNQMGDVSFGDIVGRDLIKISLILGQRDSDEEHAYRRRTIALVRQLWITGIFERSLHNQSLMALGLDYDTSAVSYPWAVDIETTTSSEPSTLAQPIHMVFMAHGSELLIHW